MIASPDKPDGQASLVPELTISPSEVACPICDRLIPLPVPAHCPFCSAPIEPVIALLRAADLSIHEAMRDLKLGDLDSVERRLELVRATSRCHRIKAEIVHSQLLRIKGNPVEALTRLNAVRDSLDESDEDLLGLYKATEDECIRDQTDLAACCELYNFALFQAKRGHYEEALRNVRKALGRVPHHALSHALLGKVLVALGDEGAARFHLRRALAIDPTNVSATQVLSRLSKTQGINPIAAIAQFWNRSPQLAGSVFVIVVLLVLAVTVLLSAR